ncbi:cyclodeaminase/cyclohydrolase family protein [candidate division WOR-3 bacterium]|nr:cyclodeaminase/cyclohydrolase family protein [candidate division WOR-3 bacterium]
MNISISDFLERLSSDAPTPGGGSVAALVGALSCSLTSMVGNLTERKKKYEEYWEESKKIIEEAKKLSDDFLSLFYEDMEVFTKLMATFGLPRGTEEEKQKRDDEIQNAIKRAIEVPLEVMEKSRSAAELALTMAKIGNLNAISDTGIAGEMALAACRSASYNVLINFNFLKDTDYLRTIDKKHKEVLKEVKSIHKEVALLVRKKIKK